MSTLAEVLLQFFKTRRNRQYIWNIMNNRVPYGGTKACKPSNIIVCLNQKFCCFSFYQTQGFYAHLDQRSKKDLDEEVAAATTVVFYDDPLNLEILYTFFLERLLDPPDSFLKSVLSFSPIVFVYLYQILWGLISLWLIRIGAYNFSNIFANHGRRCWKWHKPLPKVYIKAFAANTSSGNSSIYWDTGGIPFIVDNSATAIVFNERKLFTGPLTLMCVTLAPAEGLTITTKLVGALCLVITNNRNKNHPYSISGCVYGLESPLNILGVPSVSE